MRILAFETSAKAASVAVLEDGKLLAEYYQNSGQTHSRTVMQMAEDLLGNCDLTVSDVDAWRWPPGRAALPVCASAWRRPRALLGPADPVLRRFHPGGHGLECRHADGMVVPAMDARRSQVYTAAFRMDNGVPRRLMEDSAISLEALGGWLKTVEGRKNSGWRWSAAVL